MSATVQTKAHRHLVVVLHAARRRAGLRQTDVAKKLGRSQTWIARIESGERRIDVVELIKLCKLYRADPHKLLDRIMASGD
jgi:transcriptional regulator with XRE-family HTH domain